MSRHRKSKKAAAGVRPLQASVSVEERAAAALALISGTDPAKLRGRQVIEGIVSGFAAVSFLQAELQSWILALTLPGKITSAKGLLKYPAKHAGEETSQIRAARRSMAGAEISAALVYAPITGGMKVDRARLLREVMTDTLAAQREGRVDQVRVTMIGNHAERLADQDLIPEFERRALKVAPGLPPAKLEQMLDRIRMDLEPEDAAGAERLAFHDRKTGTTPPVHAMARFFADLRAEDAAVVNDVIDRVARSLDMFDGRTLEQRRADVFAMIFEELSEHHILDLREVLATAAYLADDPDLANAAREAENGEEQATSAGSDGDTTPDNPTATDAGPESDSYSQGDGAPLGEESGTTGEQEAPEGAEGAGTRTADQESPTSSSPTSERPANDETTHTSGDPVPAGTEHPAAGPTSERHEQTSDLDEAGSYEDAMVSEDAEDRPRGHGEEADAPEQGSGSHDSDVVEPDDGPADDPGTADGPTTPNSGPGDLGDVSETPDLSTNLSADGATDPIGDTGDLVDDSETPDLSPEASMDGASEPSNTADPGDGGGSTSPDSQDHHSSANRTADEGGAESATDEMPADGDVLTDEDDWAIHAANHPSGAHYRSCRSRRSGAQDRLHNFHLACLQHNIDPNWDPRPLSQQLRYVNGVLVDGTGHPVMSGAAGPRTVSPYRRVHLVVTVSLDTLLGKANHPGDLDGHTISAELARSIADSARTVTMLAADPATGAPAGVSERHYVPGAALRRKVLLLSQTCSWHGCNKKAERCDVDHGVPFDHDDPANGGKTSLCNLRPFCRFHHRLKTHTDWTVTENPNRTASVVSALGRRTIRPAPAITHPAEWDEPAPF
ncbi:DUF222 domain-containing protein [Nakamurella sp. YIM 132087]|uniref:DUF222 domain-containing protein n=1 Tax=Nakamurella alba TaxID=2665158 RepID=A0A7K1FGY7_9ACTN|nr:DUF222 domain-containing protein [Nakamurella alba]MTD13382.1 DUF222 domain-containing protein [Nakamurella alba]